jgi:hypothetical protein
MIQAPSRLAKTCSKTPVSDRLTTPPPCSRAISQRTARTNRRLDVDGAVHHTGCRLTVGRNLDHVALAKLLRRHVADARIDSERFGVVR